MPAWAIIVTALAGGALAGYFSCRGAWHRRGGELGEVLIRRSDSLKRVDELAGALFRAQQAAEALEADPRHQAALLEAGRLDAELRHEVRMFLHLNAAAERKGAATEVLRPPEAEALLCAHRAAS